MCKNPINYANTSIYRICSNDPAITEVYIGSTTNLRARRQQHKTTCNSPKNTAHNLPKYVFIREHGGFETWSVVLVESFPCANSEEARQRERYWVEHYAAVLNARRPHISANEKSEYYIENKNSITEKKRAKYQANKDNIKEKKRAGYQANKAVAAEYYVANKEHIKEYTRARYQANKLKKAAAIAEINTPALSDL